MKEYSMKKLQISLKYQELLFKLLMCCLDTSKYFMLKDNENINNFIGFCYFRIPYFRNYILGQIEREPEQDKI